MTTVKYSVSFTNPEGAWLKKLSSVSRARLASSLVGDPGSDPEVGDVMELVAGVEYGGAILPLLEL